MQEKIQIISDGSLDLSRELTRERDILVVPFYVSFDGETYLKEGVELDIREFYQRMVDHPDVFPKTSMPSVDDYYQVFLPLAKQDVPMICICITTKFSGSMQSDCQRYDFRGISKGAHHSHRCGDQHGAAGFVCT